MDKRAHTIVNGSLGRRENDHDVVSNVGVGVLVVFVSMKGILWLLSLWWKEAQKVDR